MSKEKKMDKNLKTILIVAAIIIAVVIFLWLASRKTQAANGANGDNGTVDLINRGTSDYIEVTKPGTTIRVAWYNQPTMGLTASNVAWNDFFYWVNSWHDQGLINQLQRDNAIAQYHNLGY